jgi:hypothetical protein
MVPDCPSLSGDTDFAFVSLPPDDMISFLAQTIPTALADGQEPVMLGFLFCGLVSDTSSRNQSYATAIINFVSF